MTKHSVEIQQVRHFNRKIKEVNNQIKNFGKYQPTQNPEFLHRLIEKRDEYKHNKTFWTTAYLKHKQEKSRKRRQFHKSIKL